MPLSVIVPALDEASGIGATLDSLTANEEPAEVIVVDGGSRDATVALAEKVGARVIAAPRGRASQMNAGAHAAHGDVLLFLHADATLPPGALDAVTAALATTEYVWGRFDITLDGRHPFLPLIAALMNIRSRLTGIATGDQAIFVTRAAFAQAGGFPDIALMEDIALSARLKRLGRPLCLRTRVVASARKWERHGVLRTIWLMWRLRLAYWLGASPDRLARAYGYAPHDV